MCGIAGILEFHGKPASYKKIQMMTDAIGHRGRDGFGILMGGAGVGPSNISIALGHRRLSIIDLSNGGMQPMVTVDGRYSIVYNGELFNYKELRIELEKLGYVFRNQSDTEVVLMAWSAWGYECLKRFNGMFAFAIWDEGSQSLHCARDALGIKPFFYSLSNEQFLFSSESRSIGSLSDGLNEAAIAAYFFSSYVPRELSIYRNIEKLLPGHYLEVSCKGQVTVRRWWSLPKMGISYRTESEAVDFLLETLDIAVNRQLQSDVPVGAFLSGGFDSGMLVSSAGIESNIHTYSAGFSGHHQLNELPIARSLAMKYRTHHHERVISSVEAISFLDHAIACMSEPLADTAIVPAWVLSQMAAADGVKVLLSGAGGDEVFGGYLRYVGHTKKRALLHSIPLPLRSMLGSILPKGSAIRSRILNPAMDMLMFAGGSTRLAFACLSQDCSKAFFYNEMNQIFTSRLSQVSAPILYKNMAFDLQVYLPDLLLTQLDQITMAHTIEGRVPLLDLDLLTASYSLNSSFHANPRQSGTRKLMRLMAKNRLDPRTFNASKQGFSGPVRSWIEENRRQFRDRTMSLRSLDCLGSINPELWWTSPEIMNSPSWAHEIFLMYTFATWYEFNKNLH